MRPLQLHFFIRQRFMFSSPTVCCKEIYYLTKAAHFSAILFLRSSVRVRAPGRRWEQRGPGRQCRSNPGRARVSGESLSRTAASGGSARTSRALLDSRASLLLFVCFDCFINVRFDMYVYNYRLFYTKNIYT